MRRSASINLFHNPFIYSASIIGYMVRPLGSVQLKILKALVALDRYGGIVPGEIRQELGVKFKGPNVTGSLNGLHARGYVEVREDDLGRRFWNINAKGEERLGEEYSK